MRHAVKPSCRFGCRFLQISDSLWLCPHASFGEGSYMIGAVQDARRMVERAGGYDKLLSDEVHAEAARRDKQKKRAERAAATRAATLRYD